MVGVGGIISVGGAGGGGSGGVSGISEINGQAGPSVNIIAGSGIEIQTPASNEILVNSTNTSGIYGANGIEVIQQGGNYTIDGSSLSGLLDGLCYSASFTNVVNTNISHNLGTTNVVVDVFDSNERKILADQIQVIDIDTINVKFNRPQDGKVVIMACGGNDANLEEAKRYALLVT